MSSHNCTCWSHASRFTRRNSDHGTVLGGCHAHQLCRLAGGRDWWVLGPVWICRLGRAFPGYAVRCHAKGEASSARLVMGGRQGFRNVMRGWDINWRELGEPLGKHDRPCCSRLATSLVLSLDSHHVHRGRQVAGRRGSQEIFRHTSCTLLPGLWL